MHGTSLSSPNPDISAPAIPIQLPSTLLDSVLPNLLLPGLSVDDSQASYAVEQVYDAQHLSSAHPWSPIHLPSFSHFVSGQDQEVATVAHQSSTNDCWVITHDFQEVTSLF